MEEVVWEGWKYMPITTTTGVAAVCLSVLCEWRVSDVCRYSLLGSGSRREEWFPGDLLASYSSQITDIYFFRAMNISHLLMMNITRTTFYLVHEFIYTRIVTLNITRCSC